MPINVIRQSNAGWIVADGRLAIGGGNPRKPFFVKTTAPLIRSMFGLPSEKVPPPLSQEVGIDGYSIDPESPQANNSLSFNHAAVAMDPRFGETVYRAANVADCIDGNPQAFSFRPAGYIECYRLILFVALKVDGREGNSESGIDTAPHQAELVVAVESYSRQKGDRMNRVSPEIRSAKFLTPFRPMMTGSAENKQQIDGFELSSTADGRFFSYKSKSAPNRGFTLFSFNERPWISDGWSHPVRISEIHAHFGNKEICLATKDDCAPNQRIPFSRRYRLVAKPFLTPEGKPLDEDFGCDYAWLSLDGSELFCQLNVRDTYAVIGERSNYVMYYIDGPLNPKRKFMDCPADFPDVCPGIAITQTLGNSHGLWPGLRDEGLSPLDRNGFVASLMVSGTNVFDGQIYGEVNFSELTDGNYLALLPMNELLQFQRASTGKDLMTPVHNSQRTPDLSGNFLNASLHGALFPDECWSATQVSTWTPDGKKLRKYDPIAPRADRWWEKTLNGFRGRGIYFPERSQLRIDVSDRPDLQQPQGRWTLEIAVKPHHAKVAGDATPVNVITKGGSWQIYLRKNGKVGVRVHLEDRDYVIESPAEIGENQWTHIAAIFYQDHRSLKLYLDGALVAERGDLPNLPSAGGSRDIVVGPELNRDQLSDRKKICTDDMSHIVYTLDELAISRVWRSEKYLAERSRASYTVATTDATTNQAFVALLPDGSLPLGLSARALRLPRGLVRIIQEDAPKFHAMASLGQDLFRDPILSTNASGHSEGVSCSSCHHRARSFTDGLTLARGVEPLSLNSPTILNRAFSTRQFFDGRASSLVAQALRPIVSAKEMNGDLDTILMALDRGPYKSRFVQIFGEVSAPNVASALAAFELTLLSGNSEYDVLVDRSSDLDLDEASEIVRGARIFFGKGRCSGCHSGTNFTDESFHATGLSGKGRPNTTRSAGEPGPFKTPTLRSIGETAPYFHDGSAATLRDVVDLYATSGRFEQRSELLPIALSEPEKRVLVRFLCALTDPKYASGTRCE